MKISREHKLKKAITGKEISAYEDAKDMVDNHLDYSIRNMFYANYKDFRKIRRAHSLRKSDLIQSAGYFIAGSFITAAAIIGMIGTNLWLSVLFLPAIMEFTLSFLKYKWSTENELYDSLYKKIKKSGKLEDLKAYMKVYENSPNFNKEKESFELREAKNNLDESIDKASRDLWWEEHRYNALAHSTNGKPIPTSRDQITIEDEDGEIYNFANFASSIRLITKMIERNNKILVSVKKDNKNHTGNDGEENDPDLNA